MTRFRNGVVALSALMLASQIGCSSPESNDTWSQWRGSGGSGVSSETDLPVEWDPETGIRWRTELESEGVSSPIVSGSRVFLTAERRQGAETALEVVAVDLDSGELLWETPVVTRGRENFPHRGAVNSAAGPTPAADGKHVYAYFGSHLVALDFKGRIVWLEEIYPDYLEQVLYGAGSSPVLSGDQVVVLRDREGGARLGWLAAFDKKTGERRWRTEWGNTCCAYTTPLVRQNEPTDEIIVFHAGSINAYRADSGEQIWKRQHSISQPAASPVIEGDTVCFANGQANDKNIGCLSLATMKKGTGRPRMIWDSSRWGPSVSSPVLYGGHLYILATNGNIKCLDGETGRALWAKRLRSGPYFASLVAGDGKIYAVTSYGSVSVLRAGPTFERLAVNEVGGTRIIASPAVVAGGLVIRTAEGLLRVGGKASGA